MSKRYKTTYFLRGFMGNKYCIGEAEYTASKDEIEFAETIEGVGIKKSKHLHRYFSAKNRADGLTFTAYTAYTNEILPPWRIKWDEFINFLKRPF